MGIGGSAQGICLALEGYLWCFVGSFLFNHACMISFLLLLHRPLYAIEQNSTFSSQFPLTVLASAPRLCHSLSESFSLLGLLSSFSL